MRQYIDLFDKPQTLFELSTPRNSFDAVLLNRERQIVARIERRLVDRDARQYELLAVMPDGSSRRLLIGDHGKVYDREQAIFHDEDPEFAMAMPKRIEWVVPRGYDEQIRDGEKRVVWVDPLKFDADWASHRHSQDFYVGPGGTGGIGRRYKTFDGWVRQGFPVEMPVVGFDGFGAPNFSNGRHRYAWMRDHGVRAMPFLVYGEDADRFDAEYGTAKRETVVMEGRRLGRAPVLAESIQDWPGQWNHMTDVPYLKINPDPSHSDPLGLYFFPASFQPNSHWAKKPYRFTMILKPDARVLDLAELDEEGVYRLVAGAGERANAQFVASIEQYPATREHELVDRAWGILQSFYARRGAAFNKMLRDLGYDAVFDDTGSIHSSEVQLLVLDPRVMARVSMERNKPNAYRTMLRIIGEVEEMAQRFGPVTVDPPRRAVQYGKSMLSARIVIGDDDWERRENYFSMSVIWSQDDRPELIRVSKAGSRPHLDFGAGAYFNIATNEWSSSSGLTSLERDIARVFSNTTT